jgi:hypothetical protein
MKNTLIKIILTSCIFILSSCDTAQSSKTKQHPIEISKGTIIINGKTFISPNIKEVSQTLGKADRVFNKINTIHVWDKLGILGYVKPGENTVSSFTIELINQDFEFSPNDSYSNDINVNSFKINQKSTESDLKKAGLNQDPTMDFIFSEESSNYSVIADYDNGVTELSISWNKH